MPGWVLVTVMTAGLVMVIWGVAEGQLRTMLRNALGSVKECRAVAAAAPSAARRSSTSCWCWSCWCRWSSGSCRWRWCCYVRNTLASAASEGARYAATRDRGPADGAARTRAQIDGAVSGQVRRGRVAREQIAGAGVEVTVHARVPALGHRRPRRSS